MGQVAIPLNRKAWLDYFLLVLYFTTSCADKLNFSMGLFRGKFSNFVALFLFFVLFSKRKTFTLNPRLFALGVLIFFSMTLSLFQAAHLRRSVGYNVVYIIEFLLYFLTSYNLIFLVGNRRILKAYILSFFIVGFYGVMQLVLSIFGIIDPLYSQFIGELIRPNAWTYEPSYLALYLTAGVAYLNADFFLSEKITKGNLILTLSLNFFLVVTTSAGGVVSYFVFLLLLVAFSMLSKKHLSVLLKSKLKKTLFRAGLVFALINILFPFLAVKFYFKIFMSDFSTHHSFVVRWKGIERAYKTFIENPILGVGVGGIGPYNLKNHRIIGTGGTDQDELEVLEKYDAQNVATEVLGSLGIFGGVFILVLSVLPFTVFVRLLKSQHIDEREKKRALALLISLYTLLIELQISPGLFRNYIWIHFGFVCGYFHTLLYVPQPIKHLRRRLI